MRVILNVITMLPHCDLQRKAKVCVPGEIKKTTSAPITAKPTRKKTTAVTQTTVGRQTTRYLHLFFLYKTV